MAGFLAGAAGGATVAIVIKAVDEFSKTFDKASESTQKLAATGKQLMGWGTALTGAGIAGGVALGGMAVEAAEAGDVFDALNKNLGSDAPKAIAEFKDALLGGISEVDAAKSINKALGRGIKNESIPALAKFAQQMVDSGRATGDVADVLDTMTYAIATGRTTTLKSMLTLQDEKQVLEGYALEHVKAQAAIDGVTWTQKGLETQTKKYLDTLTDANKEQIMSEYLLKRIGDESAELPEPQADLADKLKEVNAQWADMRIQMGMALLPVFEMIIEKVQVVINWFNGLTEGQKRFIAIALLVVAGLAILAGVILLVAGAITVLSAVSAPILLILIAIIGVVTAIIYLFFKWRDIVMRVVDVFLFFAKKTIYVAQWIKDIWKVATEDILNLWKSLWNNVLGLIEKGVNAIIIAVNKLIEAYNRLPFTENIRPIKWRLDLSQYKSELTDLNKLMATQAAQRENLKAQLEVAGGQVREMVAGKIGYDTEKNAAVENTININGNNYGTNPKEIGNMIGKLVTNKTSGFTTST